MDWWILDNRNDNLVGPYFEQDAKSQAANLNMSVARNFIAPLGVEVKSAQGPFVAVSEETVKHLKLREQPRAKRILSLVVGKNGHLKQRA